MLEDEKYQREAFQTLLLRQDDRAAEIQVWRWKFFSTNPCQIQLNSIQDQLAMVQNELAALTMVEMKKRDMKVITIIILDIVVLMFESEMSVLQWDVI